MGNAGAGRAEVVVILNGTDGCSNWCLREISPEPAGGDPRLVGPIVDAEDYEAKLGEALAIVERRRRTHTSLLLLFIFS